MKEIKVKDVKIGGKGPFVLIAGPCAIESEESAIYHAKALKAITDRVGIPFIFKASYDKANRTSIDSFRGPGIKRGLAILKKIKDKFALPILSDVHCREELSAASRVLDVIQIRALLSRQTDLIVAAAKTGKVINVKKAQFLAPWDVRHIIRKIESTGNKKIILTERGVSFGYNNLVSDFRSVLIMKEFGYPVIYDSTHSVQIPSGQGDKSGGERRFVPYLSMAAVACGVNGLFIEVHRDPDNAKSDGPNMVKLCDLEDMLRKLKKVEEASR